MLLKLIIVAVLSLICVGLYFITKPKTAQPDSIKAPKKAFIQYKLKLNILSIMEYERLTHKSFIDFVQGNKTDESDVLYMLYAMLTANNKDFNQTFENAVKYLFTNEELMRNMTVKLNDEIGYMNQFGNLDFMIENDNIEIQSGSTDNKQKIYFSQFVPPLISECGLDINYVLYQMPFTDVDLYMKYRDERKKEDLEEKRVFIYTLISPHIDNKKLPFEKFMVFPWEKQKKHKESVEYLNNQEHQRKLKEFLKSKPITFKEEDNK